MWRRVAVMRIDVSEERVDFIIRVKRVSELGTTLTVKNVVFWDVTPCGSWESWRSSETSALKRHMVYIPEDGIPHSRHRENLKSYKGILVTIGYKTILHCVTHQNTIFPKCIIGSQQLRCLSIRSRMNPARNFIPCFYNIHLIELLHSSPE
jgi:hypothetical protein